MSPRSAPLYVRAADLARWLAERSSGAAPEHRAAILAALALDARELMCSVALALSLPAARGREIERADGLVARQRAELALARDLGALAPSQERFAAGELAAMGRMLGGWQRRRRTPAHGERGAPRSLARKGAGAQAAPSA